MKQTFTFLALLSLTLLSCNNQQGTSADTRDDTDPSKSAETKTMVPGSTCYMGTSGNDVFRFKVDVYENLVTGDLDYLYSEKDQQTGIFQGRFSGDTLWADYTFESEGKMSSRPIVFLIKNDTAVEGYGDVTEIEGRKRFKNSKELQFGKGLNLNKVTCPN
jgi:hypothetical protein